MRGSAESNVYIWSDKRSRFANRGVGLTLHILLLFVPLSSFRDVFFLKCTITYMIQFENKLFFGSKATYKIISKLAVILKQETEFAFIISM